MLLRACRVNDQQFLMLTQPTNGRLPNNEATYRNLFAALRRLGHVVEHHKDNIASGLRGKGSGKGDRHAYLGEEVPDDAVDTQAYPQWNLGETQWNDNSWHTTSWNGEWNSSQSSTDGWNLSEWPQHAYNMQEQADSGTDTDTVSSVEETWYEYDDIPEGLDDHQKAEELFWAYQRAKGRYRRFMRKPVRRVRRFLKRKGKGKGKRPGYYLSTLSEPEIENVFFLRGKRKGKGKGKLYMRYLL